MNPRSKRPQVFTPSCNQIQLVFPTSILSQGNLFLVKTEAQRMQTRPTCQKEKNCLNNLHSTYFSQNNHSPAHDPLGIYWNVTEVRIGYMPKNWEILGLSRVSKSPLRHVFPLPAIIVPFVISTHLKHIRQITSNFPQGIRGLEITKKNFENHHLDHTLPKNMAMVHLKMGDPPGKGDSDIGNHPFQALC